MSRRSFLRVGAMAGGAALAGWGNGSVAAEAGQELGGDPGGDRDVAGASIAQLQSRMAAGRISAAELVDIYLRRIAAIDKGLDLRSIVQLNPDARRIAMQLDQERRRKGARGPLHGIPVLLKDNIDTADRMQTTAGSLALAGASALQDATVARRLRDAGAIILGKANLSEWANFRGFQSSSGWSGVRGQCRNPHVLDRNPCGSSSGSAAAVAAALTTVALGTETDGSVVCPSGQCGVAGIKPTVGLTSRAGVVPISDTQDTVGVHGRSVADAATVLGALTGVDQRDAKTAASAGNFSRNYAQYVSSTGLKGARIGIARQFTGATTETDEVFEEAVQVLRDAGAVVIDPVEFPSFDEFNADQSELIVLIYEFKRDLNAYLATRSGVPVGTLADVIQFNIEHAERELKFFGQELMELAESDVFSEAEYQQALVRGRQLAAERGIDAVLATHNLDAIVAPTNSPAWPTDLINGDAFLFGSSGFAAVAGYPLVSVTAGYVFGLPVGITFMASAWSEPTLIRVASGFEAAAAVHRAPRFLRTFQQGEGSRTSEKPSRTFASSALKTHAAKLDQFLVPRLRRLNYL
ncbi:amidase [Steroidobacter sp. S1-65]|uniref:Amidase n=1 Tax=Steroidobacter gossypii TaxID=2805490 RepID=A0ABS1X0R5_9GAMM|nr:amidase [Steroidobacter gossypii]MBM0106792.1 amidase [Steroidobacter gossypii]